MPHPSWFLAQVRPERLELLALRQGLALLAHRLVGALRVV